MLKSYIDNALKEIPNGILLNYAFYKGMESRNNYRYKSIIETSLYVTIIQSDLLIAVGQLRTSKTEIEKAFYARTLAMILYEYLKDLSSILGKELINNLNEIEYKEPIKQLKELNKEFSNFRKVNSNKLKIIRHKSTAHKSKNRIELVETIFNINTTSIEELTTEIIILNSKLIKIQTQIMNFISDYHQNHGQL